MQYIKSAVMSSVIIFIEGPPSPPGSNKNLIKCGLVVNGVGAGVRKTGLDLDCVTLLSPDALTSMSGK